MADNLKYNKNFRSPKNDSNEYIWSSDFNSALCYSRKSSNNNSDSAHSDMDYSFDLSYKIEENKSFHNKSRDNNLSNINNDSLIDLNNNISSNSNEEKDKEYVNPENIIEQYSFLLKNFEKQMRKKSNLSNNDNLVRVEENKFINEFNDNKDNNYGKKKQVIYNNKNKNVKEKADCKNNEEIKITINNKEYKYINIINNFFIS